MKAGDRADLTRITVVEGQRSGQPCIRGLRVTVWDVLEMLASGMTEEKILAEYPYLEKADFPAVYAFAAQAGRERAVRADEAELARGGSPRTRLKGLWADLGVSLSAEEIEANQREMWGEFPRRDL